MRRRQNVLDEKKCAAGKTDEPKCAAGKILLTESWWVLCPVDVVCNLYLQSTSQNLRSSFNFWINSLINIAPAQSTFVVPKHSGWCTSIHPIHSEIERESKKMRSLSGPSSAIATDVVHEVNEYSTFWSKYSRLHLECHFFSLKSQSMI